MYKNVLQRAGWALPRPFLCIFRTQLRWNESSLVARTLGLPVTKLTKEDRWTVVTIQIQAWYFSWTILELGFRRGWLVSFTLLPLYPRYPLDRRLGGPQSLSGRRGEEKDLAVMGIEPGQYNPSLYRLSYHPTGIQTVITSDIWVRCWK
jgi:hypothetical protein